ncbi:hypothetical protein [Flammeovirga agarivorans]|uniref:DUF4199 domain-containing protein n=1 Tax=Flammeovirga agarivorans TaxID=2726742 RepID=A0A7X8SMW6_9BACT|nr:hypothetical protein [Flammeovirga agarivorans]NLR93116.1 hypothetical protein [Flammeovirga agarivorans]
MEEQTNKIQPLKFIRPDLFKIGVIFGVISSITLSLLVILFYYLDLSVFAKWKDTFFPPVYGFMFAASMAYFRFRVNQGRILIPQGLLIGLTLNITASTAYCFILNIILSTKVMGKAIINRHIESLTLILTEGKEQIAESLTEPEYIKQVEMLKDLSASNLAFDQAGRLFLWGLFLTFVFMLIIKKK